MNEREPVAPSPRPPGATAITLDAAVDAARTGGDHLALTPGWSLGAEIAVSVPPA